MFARIEYTKSKQALAYTILSILVSLMTKKNLQTILSSIEFCSNILISTKPLTHLPLPKQKIATKRALIMLLFALFLQNIFSSRTPLFPSAALSCLTQHLLCQGKNCYLTVCSLVCRQVKQAVSFGAIKRPVEISLSFLGVCFLRQKVSTPKIFPLLQF